MGKWSVFRGNPVSSIAKQTGKTIRYMWGVAPWSNKWLQIRTRMRPALRRRFRKAQAYRSQDRYNNRRFRGRGYFRSFKRRKFF